MKIKTTMLLGGACLAAIPVLLGCYFLGQKALSAGKDSLEEDAKYSLIAIRDITASEITSYINNIEKQAVTLSESLMVIEAMEAFSEAFDTVADDLSDSELNTRQQSVTDYYTREFGRQYQQLNNRNPDDLSTLISPLDAESIALQYAFISNNPDPLGSKHLQNKPTDTGSYGDVHAKFHPIFRRFIERFGFYDLFLVNPETGDIVYSVFKELDFTTSMINGPYATSGIGQAFAMANKATSPGSTFLTDFSPYLPSYEAPASFIAIPIFKDALKIGVLIMQMPVDKINEVMTYGQRWQESGLGVSGETYLIGPDFTMRSNSRFLLEDKTNYLSLMRKIGLSENVISAMSNKDTSIGLQPVKTQGTQAAINGEEGFAIFPDYRGIPVLSAYKSLDIGGLRWAIMSEIDAEEAFAPISTLEKRITTMTTLIVISALLIGPLFAGFLTLTIFRPINKIIKAIDNLASGEGDLTQRIDDNSGTELDSLARRLNTFIADLDETFSALIKSAMRLIPMSEDLSEGNMAITKAANEQNQQITTVRSRLQQAQTSTDQVEGEAHNILEESHQGAASVKEGIKVFDKTYEQLNVLGRTIDEASDSIDGLQAERHKIASVIDVINAIAEQTNLLALNAAIEAARAGEAGRGFAVVADEVRALAARTRESTLEVSSMIEAIEKGTDAVVMTMAKGKESTEECNSQIQQAKEKLGLIFSAMDSINQKVESIGGAVVDQKNHFNQVKRDFEGLDECFNNSQKASDITVQIGVDMSKMSVKLHGMVEHFKLSDNSWSSNRREGIRIDEETVKVIKSGALKEHDQDEIFK